MSSIDERIVQMKFNASQFNAGISATKASLEDLKKNLNLDSAKKSLEGLDAAGKRFSLDGIARGVEGIASKFSAMSIVGITALTNIANKAVNFGVNLAKSLTVDPIKAGLDEYELKIGSIQTILSNTSKQGTTLKQVTASLDELNTYADKTIYNFGDMTKNIGLFTNAGIGIKDATSMIKGFSNEAAASGTSSAGAAGAAYQLSQALSAGKITLMDWKSLTNVGMGNKNMQNGIIEIADAMGTFKGTGIDATTVAKDFNGSLEKGWLKADVMSNYLKIQAGELSTAQMKTLGLSDKQITAFVKQQKIAEDAATKVRTWTQLVGTMQESVGSGWTETFDTIIGNFDQATQLWTNVNNALGPMISAAGDARNKLLKGWAKLGGRDLAIESISNGFHALMAILKPVQEAFRQIFPPTTAQQLYNITKAIRDFTQNLKIGSGTAGEIKRTFAGVFAVLDIGRMVIVGVIKMLVSLFGEAGKGSGQFLKTTASIGDFLVALRDAIKNGEGLNKFFKGLGAVLKVPINLIKMLLGAILGLFGGITSLGSSAATGSVDKLKSRLDPLKGLGEFLTKLWQGFGKVIQAVWTFFTPLANAISGFVGKLGGAVGDAMKTMDFSGVLDMINTGLLAGIVLLFKKFLKGGVKLDVGGGFLGSIKEAFGGLTDTMSAMQTQLKASTLMKIAGAIALLTASVVALSLIDSAKLTKALLALTVMFTQLFASMAIFEKIAGSSGFVKMPILAASMILLGTAILILSGAVAILSGLSWEELAKGLSGVAALLVSLAGAAKLMDGAGPGMIKAGVGMIAMALAIKILASAVGDLSGMSWEEMAKGLAGVGTLMAAIVVFTKNIGNPAGIIKTAIAMGILGVALKLMAGAMQAFSGMSWEAMAKGLAGMAGALVAIGLSMKLMPDTMLLSAVGLVVIAKALEMIIPVLQTFGAMSWEAMLKAAAGLAGTLLIIAGAMALMTTAAFGAVGLIIVAKALETMAPSLQAFGAMSWESIAKAAVMLAATLGIIAGAMELMITAAFGAVGLIIVAKALQMLAPVLTTLGGMSWDEIVHGLVALAGVFAVIGVAGLLLAPIVLPLLGLGAAILLLGSGAALAGVGLLAMSMGITALAVAGGAGIAVLVAAVSALVGLIPMIVMGIGNGIVLLLGVIASSGAAIVAAVVTLIGSILTAIITLSPQIGAALTALIMALLNAIITLTPVIITALVGLISGLLQAIVTLTPQVAAVFVALIMALLNALNTLAPQISNTFVLLIQSFLNAITRSTGAIVNAFTLIIMQLLGAINRLSPVIIQTIVTLVHNIVNAVVNGVIWMVDAGMRLILGVLNGISRNIGRIISAGTDIVVNFINGISNSLGRITTAGVNLIITFVESLASSIRNNSHRMNSAGLDLAGAIIDGMVNGIAGGVRAVIDGAVNLGRSALNAAKNILGIHSPSREFRKIGEFTGQGFVIGIDSYQGAVEKSAENMGDSAMTALQDKLSGMGNNLMDGIDTNPTIRPVIDLTDVRKGSATINDLLSAQKSLSLGSSYAKASSLAASSKTSDIQQLVDYAAASKASAASVTYNQYNNSPKALSPAEIYRQTKNQLSTTKGKVA